MSQKDREHRFPPLLYWSCGFIITTFLVVVICDQKLNGCHWYTSELVFSTLTLVVTALAFCGAITALLLQSQELGLQRKELAETRKELQRQAEAQENTLDQLKSEDIRSRLMNMFPLFIQVYSQSTRSAQELDFLAAVLAFERNPNYRQTDDLTVSKPIQGLLRLSIFCELALSYDYPRMELDRKAFATLITTTISETEINILTSFSVHNRLAYMPLVELLYRYGDLELRIQNPQDKLTASRNIEIYSKRKS